MRLWGLELAMQVVTKYDHEVILQMLLIFYKALIQYFVTIEPIGSIVVELGVFGSLVFTEEVVSGLFKAKLSLFKKTRMLTNPFKPLI